MGGVGSAKQHHHAHDFSFLLADVPAQEVDVRLHVFLLRVGLGMGRGRAGWLLSCCLRMARGWRGKYQDKESRQ
jgi:hypothetical protein